MKKVAYWEPNDYSNSNFFQKKINDVFLKELKYLFNGNVLDVGCGDGFYTNKILMNSDCDKITGIDVSPKMIDNANRDYSKKNIVFKTSSIETFNEINKYDSIISLWCLHWTNTEKSILNIYKALNDGGKFHAIISTKSKNTLFILAERYHRAYPNSDIDFSWLQELYKNNNYFFKTVKLLMALFDRKLVVKTKLYQVELGKVDDLYSIFSSLPFFVKLFKIGETSILDVMMDDYIQLCKTKYNGKLIYETNPFFISATK